MPKSKTILFLGAARFQMPPILFARRRGIRTVVCDRKPSSPCFAVADVSHLVSTTDVEGAMRVARAEHIDGIMTYGSDVSAPTVARVAEALNLGGPQPCTVDLLTHKGRFRSLLNAHNIQPHAFATFSKPDERAIASWIQSAELPVVIKPVDMSGSKGVTILRSLNDLSGAVAAAFATSRRHEIIAESYVARRGAQVCGDAFVEHGHIVFVQYGDGHFRDQDGFNAPFAETFPSSHEPEALNRVTAKVNKCLQAAGFVRGVINIDAVITRSGEPFILEIGPRPGGNYIPTAISYLTGVDLTGNAVDTCVDRHVGFESLAERFENDPPYSMDIVDPPASARAKARGSGEEDSPVWRGVACYMIHVTQPGRLREVILADELLSHLLEFNPYRVSGDPVQAFTRADEAIGNLVLGFSSASQMHDTLARMEELCRVEIEGACDAAPIGVTR